MAGVNLIPLLRSNGKTKKKIKDGSTAQKIPDDKSTIFWTFLVSLYNQIMAIMDTRGSEAKIAAIGVNFFPSSDTPVIISADTRIFIIYCIFWLHESDYFGIEEVL